MRVNNIKIVKQKFQNVWNSIRKYEYEEKFEYKVNIDGDNWSLYINKNGYEYPINSLSNPLFEANVIINSMEDYVIDKEKIIVLGSGLGYIIDELLRIYPNKKVVVIEENPEILYRFLSRIDLRDKKYMNVEQIFIGDDTGKNLLKQYLNKNISRRIGIISLPVYENIFGKEYNKLFVEMRNYLKLLKMEVGTNIVFQKRWVINSLINLKRNLETKSIYNMPRENIEGKNVIIVSAGPSLNFEIENLRKIRKENSALIFAVGSAINTLFENGINPHAALTYDPQGKNVDVYKKLIDKDEKNVPLIFGSSVGFETLKKYPGELIHMVTSQDMVSNYFLRRDNKLNIIYDAPSIAVVTLQLLITFKPKRIIFVGQNLGYFNKKYYADGVDYSIKMGEDKETGVSDEILSKAEKGIDVNGNEIYTTKSFIVFKNSIENFIKISKGIEFINTTVGGMKITGANFVQLEDVMKNLMELNDVKNYIFDYDKKDYDKEIIKKQRLEFNKSYLEYNKYVDNILEIFREMDKNRKENNINNFLPKFDKNFKAMGNNAFYNIILKPMNRISHEMLLKKVSDIKFEKDINKKVDLVIANFGKFISSLESDLQNFIEIIRMMDDELEKFVEENNVK